MTDKATRAAARAARVRAVVDELCSTPLSDEQRARIARLLRQAPPARTARRDAA